MRVKRSIRRGAAALIGGAVVAGAAVASAAETCVRTVDADAEGAGAEAALAQALADAQKPVGDGDCDNWRVDLAGTARLTDTLEWLDPVPLTLAGPDGGTARIEADDDDDSVDHRLLTVDTFPDTVTVTLERLVLAAGDVSGLVDDGLGFVEGGAILADDVALVDAALTGNRADAGGALSTFVLEATRTTFTGNAAELGVGTDGAVLAYGDVDLENVTFVANLAGQGGAIWADLSDEQHAEQVFLHAAHGFGDVRLGGHVLAGGDDEPREDLRGLLAPVCPRLSETFRRRASDTAMVVPSGPSRKCLLRRGRP